MKRREFISLLGGAAAVWPLAARAQLGERALRRIGVLMGIADDQEGQARLTALKRGLQESGWTDAHNIQIDVRWGGGDIGQIRADAAELVNTRPDIILVYSTRVLNAMRQATQNIPVVFLATSDPVGLGYVKSLAHPGGNLTGFMLYEVSVAGKLVELLKEMNPALARVGHLFNPDNLQAAGFWGSIESVAASMGVVPVELPVRDAPTIQDAIDRFARDRNGGLVRSLPAKSRGMIMIDVLIFALAAVAMGIPAIITAATLGSKLKFDW